MLGIYLRMLKDRWKSLVIYSISTLALAEMYVALYPTMREALVGMDQFMKSFPEGFMDAFGFNAADLTFQTVEHLLSTELFTFMWPIIAIIMATSLATYSIVGDMERGTIEVIISQPVSRIRIFIARALGGITILTFYSFVSAYGIIPLTIMHNIDYNLGGYWYMSVLGTMFAFGVFGIAMFFSALFSEKGKAIFGVVGILITMYAVNIASGLVDKLEKLQYTSFFYYLDAGSALVDESFVKHSLFMFLGVGAVAIIAAAFRFNTRDITT